MEMPCDFFIIGAAKAGTTSLYHFLAEHPDIFMPARKEPEVFARDDLYDPGLEEYRTLFSPAVHRIKGEASTIYSLSPFFPRTAERIARHAPDAKLIYIMRDPIERAFSYYIQITKNYQNATQDFSVNRTFEDFALPERHARAAPRDLAFAEFDSHLPDDPELCLAGGDYVLQIEAYMKFFSKSQFLFLTFEDFIAEPRSVLREVTDFLGVRPLSDEEFGRSSDAKNVSLSHFQEVSRIKSVARLKTSLGVFWALRRAVPVGARRKIMRDLIPTGRASNSAPPPMEAATRAKLTKRYLPMMADLERVTNREFPQWFPA